ncbi:MULTISPECIES: hypothetical protein [unclassified Nocardiopsis]|uniref:hypothetical protein n=1 Tax=Nocardiopsis TaxID=2013 RepID=UPI00387B7E0E
MTEDRHIPGLDGVDEVPWDTFQHFYGSAGDLRERLKVAFTAEEVPAREAVTAMLGAVHHQGGAVLPVSVPLLPFLLRLAADPTRPAAVRRAAVFLVVELARCGCEAERGFVAPGWEDALAAAVPGLVALLADPEPELRSEAASALAWTPADRHGIPSFLRSRWEREPDEQVRLVLLESAARFTARLTARHPDGAARIPAAAGDVRWLLDLRDHGDVDERAIIALTDPLLLPDDPVGLFAEAVERDGRPPWQRAAFRAYFWRRDTEERFRRLALLRVSRALAARPDARTGLARRLLGSPYPGARLGAVDAVTGLVAEFRGAETVWADTAGELLGESVTEARTIAAQILAVAGEAAVPWADALAERSALSEDRAERASALLALARLRDPRAVPLLVERAGEPCFGLSRSRGHRGWSCAPGLPDVLEPLVHEADTLMPWLRERLLRDGDDALGVLLPLESWGPAAAPLTDKVAAHLDTGRRARAALNVLAAIGPAAARHAETVRRNAEPGRGGAAAPAFWRLTGDAEGALDLIGGFHRRQRGPVWALLAELGPAAARHLDTVRRAAGEDGADPRAALALWRLTGDTDTVLRLLLDGEAAPMTALTALWQGREAVRVLGEMGAAAAPALPRLRALRADPRRPRSQGRHDSGWRDVVQDRELLDLLDGAIARIEG